jgi:hypothetical protein
MAHTAGACYWSQTGKQYVWLTAAAAWVTARRCCAELLLCVRCCQAEALEWGAPGYEEVVRSLASRKPQLVLAGEPPAVHLLSSCHIKIGRICVVNVLSSWQGACCTHAEQLARRAARLISCTPPLQCGWLGALLSASPAGLARACLLMCTYTL